MLLYWDQETLKQFFEPLYILKKRKPGAYTWPCTPNRGFHPIRTIPHSPWSPRTHIHNRNLSIVNSNTDTRAWAANDKGLPWANTPLPGWTPGQIRSPPPSAIHLHRSIEQFFLFSSPSHPQLALHTSTSSHALTVILPVTTGFYRLTRRTSRQTHRPA